MKHWDKRNSDIALCEINQELEYPTITAKTGSKREDKLVWRTGNEEQTLPRKLRKILPRNWKIRRICCEETDRARQARIDELSVHQKRDPTPVSQLLTQNQELLNKSAFLVSCERILQSWNSEQFWSDPRSQSALYSSSLRTMPCRDSGLPHDPLNIVGTSGNVFERLPAREGRTSALFENSKNLASSAHEMRPDISGNTMVLEREMRREPQNSSIPVPRFQSGGGILNHTGGTCFHGGMNWLHEISNLVGNASRKVSRLFWNFKSGKSTSRLKYVRNQQILTSQCTGSKKLK